MAVAPVGNNGFHYIPVQSAAQAESVGAPAQTGKADMIPGECKT